MKGLELSRAYYREACAPILARELPAAADRIAVGLVGEGSDCFGWDDARSRDHSWGPRLCLWLTEEDYRQYGARAETVFAMFPASFRGFPAALGGGNEGRRSGVYRIGEFYSMLTGLPHAPQTNAQWLAVPEVKLAAAVNGEVFCDPVGAFSEIRQAILDYYPEDVRLRLIAERAAAAAQTGQYNLVRCRLHEEDVAAAVVKARFAENAAAMVFLLNRRFRPFYKWAYRALRELPVLGAQVYEKLNELLSWNDVRTESQTAESISALLIAEMRRQNLTSSGSDFLMDHCPELLGRIRDGALQGRPIDLAF